MNASLPLVSTLASLMGALALFGSSPSPTVPAAPQSTSVSLPSLSPGEALVGDWTALDGIELVEDVTVVDASLAHVYIIKCGQGLVFNSGPKTGTGHGNTPDEAAAAALKDLQKKLWPSHYGCDDCGIPDACEMRIVYFDNNVPVVDVNPDIAYPYTATAEFLGGSYIAACTACQ